MNIEKYMDPLSYDLRHLDPVHAFSKTFLEAKHKEICLSEPQFQYQLF